MHTSLSSIQSSLPPDDELETIHALLGDEFLTIARMFVIDSAARLDTLSEATSTSDIATMEKISHVLCGSAASIGASAMARYCSAMEMDVRRGQLQQSDVHLLTIRNEYERVAAKLDAMQQAG